MKRPDDLLEHYCRTARPIQRKYMRANSCIGATRLTCDYFGLLGIQAAPRPVKMVVTLPDSKLIYASGVTEEELATAGRRQRYSFGDGATWNGHLVAIVEKRWLLDPSFDQAVEVLGLARSEQRMLLIPLPERFAENPDRFKLTVDGLDDRRRKLRIEYIETRDDSYLETEAWTDDNLPKILPEIARAMGTYSVGGDQETITCHLCGTTSSRRQDIAQRYCVRCASFHHEPEMEVTA